MRAIGASLAEEEVSDCFLRSDEMTSYSPSDRARGGTGGTAVLGRTVRTDILAALRRYPCVLSRRNSERVCMCSCVFVKRGKPDELA